MHVSFDMPELKRHFDRLNKRYEIVKPLYEGDFDWDGKRKMIFIGDYDWKELMKVIKCTWFHHYLLFVLFESIFMHLNYYLWLLYLLYLIHNVLTMCRKPLRLSHTKNMVALYMSKLSSIFGPHRPWEYDSSDDEVDTQLSSGRNIAPFISRKQLQSEAPRSGLNKPPSRVS